MMENDIPNNRIGRRTFIQLAAAGAIHMSMKDIGKAGPKYQMGVVVHSYASRWNSKVPSTRYPGFKDAIEMLQHCHTIGAGGIQVMVRGWDKDFVNRFRRANEKLGMYLEGSIWLPASDGEVESFDHDIAQAKAAGATVVRTVCLTGRRYESFHTAQEFKEFKKNAIASLKRAEPVVRKHKVKLAVENHKDWRAEELISILDDIGSEWLGVTLDFGNSISLIEDPMDVLNTLAPRAFTTHVKDMGVAEYEDGFLLSEVPLGQGLLDLPLMFEICRRHNPSVTFNLEMITRDPLKIPCLTDRYWNVFEGVSGRELAGTLRMVKSKRFKGDLPTVSRLSDEERLAVEEENIIESFRHVNSWR